MKVYIVHGRGGSPQEPMLQWLKSSLEARDYSVTIPAMPDPEAPKIDDWVEKLARNVSPNEETILVGHSMGCQAILRYLGTLGPKEKVRGIVLIAPFTKVNEKTLGTRGREAVAIIKPWIEIPIDFKKAKESAGKTIAIFSDNDRWVPLEERVVFERELGATIITEKGKGHFTARDGITTLPSALNAVLGLA